MQTAANNANICRAYRRRIAARGRLQFIADLPRETVAFIDELKERQGLRNRGQVIEQENSARELLRLFEQRREAAQK